VTGQVLSTLKTRLNGGSCFVQESADEAEVQPAKFQKLEEEVEYDADTKGKLALIQGAGGLSSIQAQAVISTSSEKQNAGTARVLACALKSDQDKKTREDTLLHKKNKSEEAAEIRKVENLMETKHCNWFLLEDEKTAEQKGKEIQCRAPFSIRATSRVKEDFNSRIFSPHYGGQDIQRKDQHCRKKCPKHAALQRTSREANEMADKMKKTGL